MSSYSNIFASRNRAVKMQVPVISMALVPPSLPIIDVECRTHIPFACHLRHLDECAYDVALSITVDHDQEPYA
jgi:hypothetical protein